MWVPALNIFESSFRRGKFDESRKLSNGSLMDFAKIYPMDAVFDTPEDVPEEACPALSPWLWHGCDILGAWIAMMQASSPAVPAHLDDHVYAA